MEYIGNVILPEGIAWGAKVVCRDGRITRIVPGVTKDCRDLPYIAPGYIDIHNHGALGHDYMEATPETFRLVADYLASRGVTATQCTTVSAPVEQLDTFFAAYRAYQETADDSRCR